MEIVSVFFKGFKVKSRELCPFQNFTPEVIGSILEAISVIASLV